MARNQNPNGGTAATRSRREGFTLIELLLVTVIIGLLASIVSPTFQRARERALVSQMLADGRHMIEGLEVYLSLNGDTWPSNIDDFSENGSFVKSEEVEICMFFAVPSSPWRDGYIISMIAHPGTTTNVLVVYPLWTDPLMEYDSGRQGC